MKAIEQAPVEGSKTVLARCREEVKSIDPSADIVLYGSRAQGDADPDSDHDILIVTDGPATIADEDHFRRSIYPIELETGAVLTIILVARYDWNSSLYDSMPFCRNNKREGVLL